MLATQEWYLFLELPVANADAGELGEHVRSLCRGYHALVGTSLTSVHRQVRLWWKGCAEGVVQLKPEVLQKEGASGHEPVVELQRYISQDLPAWDALECCHVNTEMVRDVEVSCRC